MSSLNNVSYFFIPFGYDRHEDFHSIVKAINNGGLWQLEHDEIKYMLKYVADKINSYNEDTCQCFHYVLDNSKRDQFGLAGEKDWFSTVPHRYRGKETPCRFNILAVHLYCFSTAVGIIAFKVHFENNDPFWVSNAQYYMKKVSREEIFTDSVDNSTTMLDISKALLSDISLISPLTYFFYANPSTERSNMLTYLEVAKKDDYKRELFYLKRCYGDGYNYTENEQLDSRETFSSTQGIIWGISPEAAICLACPETGTKKFIQGKFYENFNGQYLFMYVLLLHQKYVLYMFLTRIGIGTHNNLNTLEDYRHQLYEFETDFVFSCVTEVPQYQNLYERMSEAFALKKMYEDVNDSLISLGEIRRETLENEQKKRDMSVNRALLLLSVLSFFSALIDSFDFASSFFSWFLGEAGVKVVQIACIIGIVLTVIFVFKNLFNYRFDKTNRRIRR